MKKIDYDSRRGQEICILLSALDELRGVSRKSEVINHIIAKGWIVTSSEDMKPYAGEADPRFYTLLAWAKKDALERDYVFDSGRDCWEITRGGVEAIKRARRLFAEGEWSVRRCYMFSTKFKLLMDPSYVPGDQDLKHPDLIFEELIGCL